METFTCPNTNRDKWEIRDYEYMKWTSRTCA